MLGYVTLDVETVWEEEDHQFYRKWAILNSPKSDFAGPTGYLKVTISIITEGQVPIIPIVNPLENDDIDGNLLLPDGITQRNKALFVFKLYNGYDIIKAKHTANGIDGDPPEKDMSVAAKSHLPDVSVKITFAGLTGKTSVKEKTSFPVWNESVTISELYPPLSQRIKIDLLYRFKGRGVRVARRYIHMHSICSYKPTTAFLPTFGPAYLHFYKRYQMGEEYVGKILLALETKIFTDAQTRSRTSMNEQIPPIFEASHWKSENILLFTTITSAAVIDKRYSKEPISFELSWGRLNWKKESDEPLPSICTPNYKPLTKNQDFWYLNFEEKAPCMHIIGRYPAMQKQMFKTNQLDKILTNMADQLLDIRDLFKSKLMTSFSEMIGSKLAAYFDFVYAATGKLKDVLKSRTSVFDTQLDVEKDQFIIRELSELHDSCKSAYSSRMKKKSFRTAEQMYKRMFRLLDYPQESWPNIYLWMRRGNRRVECLKFEPRDIVYAKLSEESGKYAGQLNNFYYLTKKRSTSLSPVVCKIELFTWLGLEVEKGVCMNSLPNGFKNHLSTAIETILPQYLCLDDYVVFNCRAHIYQGRFMMAFDQTGLSDFFARIIIHDRVRKTKTIKQTLNPIWDQTLILSNIVCYGTREEIKNFPPAIVLEVNDVDRWSLEYVGFCLITPSIKFKNETYSAPSFPPKLEWHKIRAGGKEVGEVLAAVEYLEISTEIELNQLEMVEDESLPIPADIRPILVTYRFEIFVWGVRHLKKLKHLPIHAPRIVVECSTHKIETDIANIAHMNFVNNLVIVDMKLPNMPSYIPPIIIKLFECRQVKRQIYAGTHLSFIQDFLYTPITAMQYKRRCKVPMTSSLLSCQSETTEELDANFKKLRKQKLRSDKRNARMWRLLSIFNCSNLGGLCKNCMRGCCGKFKKILRFICCFLLCCGCGRMFRKKEVNKAPPKTFHKHTAIDMPFTEDVDDDIKDWWSKYFNSLGDPYTQIESEYDRSFRIKIYDQELEKQSAFGNFEDAFSEYRIYRGKTTGDEYEDMKAQIATLKCKIAAYEWGADVAHDLVTPNGRWLADGYFQNMPSNAETKFVVRVYCVRAIKLRPTDASGSSDSYIVIRMNHQVIDDRAHYVPKTANPFYGKCYELEGSFPKDNTLTVCVYDSDRHSHTDLIGQTKIDIENRFYSRHRANCGLPLEYTLYGKTPWRDHMEPTEILRELCEMNNLDPPVYKEQSMVQVGCMKFKLPKDADVEREPEFVKKEALALHALHKWQEVPAVGYQLVPEHVETRSLYHPKTPGLEQGKLQMWVDVFPISLKPTPYQVDIKTRKPITYELRVVIWNTENVPLNEDDFFGDRKSDIYVKGCNAFKSTFMLWVTNPGDAQSTDVHYRSLTGEGNFNWRFVFAFDYLSAENMIVEEKKQKVFGIDQTERKLPCRLTLQVWDNDIFTKDDFIGSLTLYLNKMPRGAKVARQCSLKNFASAPRFNLFKTKRVRGWWPFQTKGCGDLKPIIAGQLEAEFELLQIEQASLVPVGIGRDAPQPLPPPKRPSSSFNWLMNPWKTCKFIVWKNTKWKLLICMIIVLAAFFLGLFLYSVPGYSVKKLLHA